MITQILLNSIISALLLSLVALGFNLIFNATKVFHLAHGAMYITAVYATFAFRSVFLRVASLSISTAVSILLSLLLISALVVAVEYLVYRPLYLKKVNPTISMISSLGVYFLVVNLIALVYGNESVALNNNYSIIVANSYFKVTNIELLHLIIGALL